MAGRKRKLEVGVMGTTSFSWEDVKVLEAVVMIAQQCDCTPYLRTVHINGLKWEIVCWVYFIAAPPPTKHKTKQKLYQELISGEL